MATMPTLSSSALLILTAWAFCAAVAQGTVCDKCNVPVSSGGCKCDNNCNCLAASKFPPPPPAGSPCSKCNVPVASGGCKCDNNCNCLSAPTSSPTSSPSSGGGSVVLSGTATGSYYYDVRTTCPGEASNTFSNVNSGVTACESFTSGPNQQSLAQRNTNNIIAIGQLTGSASQATRKQFCGKQVIVTLSGARVQAPDGGDFFVWDGCEACAQGLPQAASRIDFSESGLRAVSAQACQQGLVQGVSYQITSVQVLAFVP